MTRCREEGALSCFYGVLMLKQWLIRRQKIMKFLIVGVFNTALGLGLFPLFYWLFPSYRSFYVWMLLVSQCICVLNSYLMNKHFVFRTQGNYKLEMLKFLLFHFLYLGLTLSLIPFLVNFYDINPVFVQMSIGFLVVMTSYVWYNKFTFLSYKKGLDRCC